jgi:non-ribosomal peptide synthetase component F
MIYARAVTQSNVANSTKPMKRLTTIAPTLMIILLSAPLVASAALTNPLGTTDVRVVIGNIIQALLGVTGALALLMFVWGGFQWLISGGSADRVKKGKDTLIWATIGLVVIILAYTLVSAVVTGLTTGSIS